MIKKRILFYVISFTWGIIMSILGLLLLIPFAITKRVHVYHGRLYGVIKSNGGYGFELGCFFFITENCKDNEHMKAHESGHGIQNCFYGPLMLFLVSLPSTIRFWYRRFKYYVLNKKLTTAYEDIWFEKQATDLGYGIVKKDLL